MNAEPNTILKSELAHKLERLSEQASIWGAMDASQRADYLNKMLSRLQGIEHQKWGEASSQRQGFDPKDVHGEVVASAEQMINGSIMVGTLRALLRTYTHLEKTGAPPPLEKRDSIDGREILSVFPYDLGDKLNPYGIAGVKGEIWRNPTSEPTLSPSSGKLSLVLGAGNQSFLAFGDVMHEMFVKGNVTILKHHPVREFCAPFYEELFQDLIEDGFFVSTLGDLEISKWLCEHNLTEAVHMTGGTATHDNIVWGSGAEQAKNKEANTPVLQKPMTSELGCITPWIISSGAEWTEKQLKHHAAHLAMAFISQNSCNCLSPKLLVVDDEWPQLNAFLDHLRSCLNKAKLPPPYYPGSEQRYLGFKDAYGEEGIEIIQSEAAPARNDHGLGEPLGWMLIDIDSEQSPYVLQNEAFSPVLGIYRLKGGNQAEEFLPKAVTFVNDHVWGTLSCTLLLHDKILSSCEAIIEQAIADLRYGSIAINAWTATVYGMDGCVWGAYPGEPLNNVASGIGFVRNAFLINDVEKSVLRSSFVHSGQLTLSETGQIPLSSKQFQAISKLNLKPSPVNIMNVIWQMMFSRP